MFWLPVCLTRSKETERSANDTKVVVVKLFRKMFAWDSYNQEKPNWQVGCISYAAWRYKFKAL